MIGRNISLLRKKNKFTQEKLANMLGVTSQAVSKWECGVSVPDLYMILSLARIFHVTTDFLLGAERETKFREEFEDAYNIFVSGKNYDKIALYNVAKNAVLQFPEELKYMRMLADLEVYLTDSNLIELTEIQKASMREHALGLYERILRNSDDVQMKEDCKYNIILTLDKLGQYDKAKEYAMEFPQYAGHTQNMMLELCTHGKELLELHQKQVKEATIALIWELLQMMEDYTEYETKYSTKAGELIFELIEIFKLSDDKHVKNCVTRICELNEKIKASVAK